MGDGEATGNCTTAVGRGARRALVTLAVGGLLAASACSSDAEVAGVATTASTGVEEVASTTESTAAPSTTVAPTTTSASTTTVVPAPDPLMADDAIVFEVEVVEQGLGPFPPGAAFPNCYTFHPDGAWDDPGFPDLANPVPGTWESTWADGTAGYAAAAESGDFTLEQVGVVTVGEAGQLEVVADSTMLQGGELFLELVSTGVAVDRCSLFEN